jgi:hypothetical protein
LQVLLSRTEEGGEHECLDIIPGEVKKLPGNQKIPHMGWNTVKIVDEGNPLVEGLSKEEYVYFVHSYYAEVKDREVVVALTLAACYVPGRALMHYFSTLIMMPHHYARTIPGWKEEGMPQDVPWSALFHFDEPGNHGLGQLGWCEAAFAPAFEERSWRTASLNQKRN